MLEVMVNGCYGKMGQIVCDLIEQNENLVLKCGFDKNITGEFAFPVYDKIENIVEKPDVIIDFSIPVATLTILQYAVSNHVPIVIATTGFTNEEELIIKEASKKIPIFKSANMSYDIMIMKKLVQWLAPLLKNTDIEITETHHNRKIDSPSGTAQMLADSINKSLGNSLYYEYNRHDKHEKRNKNEIGINSLIKFLYNTTNPFLLVCLTSSSNTSLLSTFSLNSFLISFIFACLQDINTLPCPSFNFNTSAFILSPTLYSSAGSSPFSLKYSFLGIIPSAL